MTMATATRQAMVIPTIRMSMLPRGTMTTKSMAMATMTEGMDTCF